MPEEKSRGLKKDVGGIGERVGKGVGSSISSQRQSGAGRSVKQQSGAGARLRKEAGTTRPKPAPAAPTLSEEERSALSQRASSLGSRLSGVRTEASLGDLRSSLGRLDSSLNSLPAALEEVRQRGYVYRGYLENKIEVLRRQWQGLRDRVDSEAAQQGRLLMREADGLQRRLSRMGSDLHAATLDAIERDIDALEGKVDDVVRALQGTFDTIESNTHQTERQIQSVRWVQEQVAAASFGLRPEENAIEAVSAQYLTDGDDGPKGILYLTDQRLLFEQKEDIATKKFLFVTTERERVQKLLLEAPIGGVQPQASERGALMFKKELLEVALTSADVSQALFRLEADSESWAALIGRVRTGEIAGERIDAEEAPPPAAPTAAAPTVCPTCGANITTEIVKGMQSVTCEYCGTVIRL